MTLARPLVPMAERTLPAVLARAVVEHPDAPALRDPGRALTYAQAVDEATRLGGGLAAEGTGTGDAVLLMLDNHVDFALCWLGLGLLGAVEVPINTAYRGYMLAYLINDSGARALVIEDAYCNRIAEVAGELDQLEVIVVRGGSGAALPSGRFRIVSLDSVRAGEPGPAHPARPWDLTAIMYTSGTTGRSKGVLASHAHAYGYCTPALWGAAGPNDVVLVTLPLFHVGGQWAGVYNALIAGAEAVILDRFHATTYWDDVRRYRITYTLLLGAMAGFLFRQPERPDDADNSMQRALVVPVIPEVDAFSARFRIQVGTAYGSTEGSSTLFSAFGQAQPGSCGRPRDDFEARLVDEHDVEVLVGQTGELLLRSREPWSVMCGYHGRPSETAAVWRNQWLHTGDSFYQDETGSFHFVDRMVDRLRRRGENISSFEVESGINQHPMVVESAAIPVSSEHTEDEILAFVVLRPEQSVTAADLVEYLARRMPYFMVPRYLEFVDELPKTPTEKVKKEELRKRGLGRSTWDREAAGVTVRR